MANLHYHNISPKSTSGQKLNQQLKNHSNLFSNWFWTSALSYTVTKAVFNYKKNNRNTTSTEFQNRKEVATILCYCKFHGTRVQNRLIILTLATPLINATADAILNWLTERNAKFLLLVVRKAFANFKQTNIHSTAIEIEFKFL